MVRLMILAVMCLAIAPLPSTKPAGPDHLAGTIAKVNDGSIVVKPEAGKNEAMTVTDDTAITVDGVAAKATDLKVGQNVKVTWTYATGHAERIEVVTAKDKPKKKKKKDA